MYLQGPPGPPGPMGPVGQPGAAVSVDEICIFLIMVNMSWISDYSNSRDKHNFNLVSGC